MEALDRSEFLRWGGLGNAAVSVPWLSRSGDGSDGNFPSHPGWRFVFVSHLTTYPPFVPVQYGIQDACALVGCTYEWTGSARGDVDETVRALNAAIGSKADAIAVSLVDSDAFDEPVERALQAGIPVVAFNTDAPARSGNKRLAFIGQDPYSAGFKAGERLAKLVPRGEVALFAGAPGLEVRIDGAAAAIRRSGSAISLMRVAAGDNPYDQERAIQSAVLGRRKLRGLLAGDAGATEALGRVMKRYGLHARGVRAGGFDVLPSTLELIDQGHLDFTVDPQPYVQGFAPVMQLFLTKLSGGLVAPADVRTGLLFVTKANVKPYLTTKTRYEGSSSKPKYPIS